MVRKLGNVKQVACHSGHNLTYFGIVKVAERELFKVVKQVAAHIGFQPRAHDVTHVRHVVVCNRVDNSQKQIRTAEPQHG